VSRFTESFLKRRREWPALADSTREAKGSFGELFIMQESRDTYFSLTRKGDKNAVFEATDKEAVMGTRLSYPRYHMGPYKKRPKREPIRSEPREEFKRKLLSTARKESAKYTRRRLTLIQTEEGIFD
jgi:hypothetical protein